MEPFKDRINSASIDELCRILPGDWDRLGFRKQATHGLESLELKARVQQIANALRHALPQDYLAALKRIVGSLPPSTDLVAEGTSNWAVWPLCTFVELFGGDHVEASLDAMEHLTPYWSCEFAIRPYFAADPERVLTRLETWTSHPSAHVRRLVTEGTRPRLPWGQVLRRRIERPDELLPLLERLRDDSSEYVRRSVANHLNDISKDHAERVLEIAGDWLVAAPPSRVKLVRHALRTRIEAGDPGAFGLIGLAPFVGEVTLSVQPSAIQVGDALRLRVVLDPRAEAPQRVRIDIGLHFLKADGRRTVKVFHWTERTVEPGVAVGIDKVFPIKKVSTRRLYAGEHAVDVRVNGKPTPCCAFGLHIPS